MNIFDDLKVEKGKPSSFEYNGEIYDYDGADDLIMGPDLLCCPAIFCPYCFNSKFQISYDENVCIAHCDCGHEMPIYRG